MSVDKLHKDMAKPREVALRGTAADLTANGLDMLQGTRTPCHTHKAPTAVEAMTCASLRPGAFSMLPQRSSCGYASIRMEAVRAK